MRHNVVTKTLNKTPDHRKAMMKNLAASLVFNESIVTTIAKAKYLRPYIEKLVTSSRKGDINAVRHAIVDLGSDLAARKLVKEIAPKYMTRNGGYTRIVRLARRDGDKAEMAKIEFVKDEAKKVTKEKTAKVEAPKKLKEVKVAKKTKEVQATKVQEVKDNE